jgi:hypothetical protein
VSATPGLTTLHCPLRMLFSIQSNIVFFLRHPYGVARMHLATLGSPLENGTLSRSKRVGFTVARLCSSRSRSDPRIWHTSHHYSRCTTNGRVMGKEGPNGLLAFWADQCVTAERIKGSRDPINSGSVENSMQEPEKQQTWRLELQNCSDSAWAGASSLTAFSAAAQNILGIATELLGVVARAEINSL